MRNRISIHFVSFNAMDCFKTLTLTLFSLRSSCLLLVIVSAQSYGQMTIGEIPVKVFSKKGASDDF